MALPRSHNRPPHTGSAFNNALRLITAAVVLVSTFVASPSGVLASPGRPDRAMHPYVGVLGWPSEGGFSPYCHVTLISSTEAITAHHCAPTGSEVALTLDNPVVEPATIHTGTVRMGGWDFGAWAVDLAIIDLDVAVALPRYAKLPPEPIAYGRGMTLDFVTYVALKQSCQPSQFAVHECMQNEPAHVAFDRNVLRTTAAPGMRTAEVLFTLNPTCFGNSGSPVFVSGTDVVGGVLSGGGGKHWACTGGLHASRFARTDSELAIGILTATVPPLTAYPPLVPARRDDAHFDTTQGSGTSGTLSFSATVPAGSEYSASVTGLSPAQESTGEVDQDGVSVFAVSVSPGFRSFLAMLRDEYTSGAEDDLDIFLVWYFDLDGDGVNDPVPMFSSEGEWSDELAMFSSEEFVPFEQYLEDPYNFEVWVLGSRTDGSPSAFTLFTQELMPGEAGNLVVTPVTAGPGHMVEVPLSWAALDPSYHMYFGMLDHFVDGVPEPTGKSTLVQINAAP